ncbi:MAG: alpha/beta fold hydrolase [Oligoflexia bacterium]|nr:alpha/beta fold hydrolase [Oligoflexia bacterium]
MLGQGFGSWADLSSSDCARVQPNELAGRAIALNRCAQLDLYAFPSQPFAACDVQVAAGRAVHVEQFGNPQGAPVVYVHGGLVTTLAPQAMGFLDVSKLRIVSLHQRGAGKSSAVGDLREHSPQHSASDLEVVRNTLSISSWHVYAHSFGSSIALLYACQYLEKCRSLIVHGAFLPGAARSAAFYEREQLRSPEVQRSRCARFDVSSLGELFQAYAVAIESALGPQRDALVRSFWGMTEREEVSQRRLDYTRLALWYRTQDYFLADGWLDEACERLHDCEVRIVHSAEDETVPVDSSLELTAKLPRAGLSLALGQHFHRAPADQSSLRRVFDRFSWD